MSQKTVKSLLVVFIVGAVLFIVWHGFFRNDYDLPTGETTTETVIIRDGQVVSDDPENNTEESQKEFDENMKEEEESFTTREILVTDGVRHSVPLKEILSGGPPKDGIPPIDNPKFISVTAAGAFLNDQEPGIAIDMGGVNRFYPYQILVWHEIVNDSVNGKRILVTYCPLCISGVVFDPVVKEERVEFGTSGRLWNSNLVMYDRKTDSLWSQVLGEAIVGEMTGTILEILPSDVVRFGDWKKLNPKGEVLSKDTGAVRFYGTDPYGDYYTTPGTFFPIGNEDKRLADKDFVLGVVVNGKAKAYLPTAIQRDGGEVEDEFNGKTIVLRYEKNIDAVRMFEKTSDGLKRINPLPNFWFSWAAAYPDTELYK